MPLFGKDKLFSIADEEGMFKELTRRRHWKQIDPAILRRIFDNAKGDMARIRSFVYLSEYHGCVENNFVELAQVKQYDPREACSSFATTLESLAYKILQSLDSIPAGSDRYHQSVAWVEIAHLSAILCDQYQLPAYNAIGWLYHEVGMDDKAIEWCRRYDEVETLLRQTNDSELTDHDLAAKEAVEEISNLVNYLKEELGLPHAPLEPIVEKGLCPKCGNFVVPTTAGTCPECNVAVVMPDFG